MSFLLTAHRCTKFVLILQVSRWSARKLYTIATEATKSLLGMKTTYQCWQCWFLFVLLSFACSAWGPLILWLSIDHSCFLFVSAVNESPSFSAFVVIIYQADVTELGTSRASAALSCTVFGALCSPVPRYLATTPSLGTPDPPYNFSFHYYLLYSFTAAITVPRALDLLLPLFRLFNLASLVMHADPWFCVFLARRVRFFSFFVISPLHEDALTRACKFSLFRSAFLSILRLGLAQAEEGVIYDYSSRLPVVLQTS